jgi:molybdopterin converting factor small subunit
MTTMENCDKLVNKIEIEQIKQIIEKLYEELALKDVKCGYKKECPIHMNKCLVWKIPYLGDKVKELKEILEKTGHHENTIYSLLDEFYDHYSKKYDEFKYELSEKHVINKVIEKLKNKSIEFGKKDAIWNNPKMKTWTELYDRLLDLSKEDAEELKELSEKHLCKEEYENLLFSFYETYFRSYDSMKEKVKIDARSLYNINRIPANLYSEYEIEKIIERIMENKKYKRYEIEDHLEIPPGESLKNKMCSLRKLKCIFLYDENDFLVDIYVLYNTNQILPKGLNV